MGVENLLNLKGQKKDRKDMISWGCGGTGHGWRECLTPREGNNLPFKLANQNSNGKWGRKHRPPILPNSQPGRSQCQQTTKESWGIYGTRLSQFKPMG